VQTSIRLAGTQRITAVARMSDGSLWSGGVDVIVTQAACLDDT
jgi:sulfur-oxidizing protein SoxY